MFYEYFNQVPVAINNLYGDPFIQKENTFQKLDNLEKVNHKGIVAIITKTEITEEVAIRLSKYSLNIVVFVSISELPYEIEKIKCNRYNTLKLCNKYNIHNIAYIRPFIPNMNTEDEIINKIFKNIYESGTTTVVVAGLRGSDSILSNSRIDDEDLRNWSLRVKIIPKDVRKCIEENKEKYPSLHIFERTGCAASFLVENEKSYNSYWFSPQLAKCLSCPLKETCYDKQENFTVNDRDIKLAEFLGYKVKRVNAEQFQMCGTDPAKRTECVSCCTNCFMLTRDALEIERFDGITLGDVSLLRLLIQKHVFCRGVIDTGNSDVARPNNPHLKNYNLYMLNSWWSYSNNINQCYGCSYCIVPMYQNQNMEYGMPPEEFYKTYAEGSV